MIIAINQSWRKKAVLCFVMVILVIMMQCVYPLMQAHAVAAVAGAVAAAAIAALLVMIGVKILPKADMNLDVIYSNIIKTIQKGGDTVYPLLTGLFNDIVTNGIKIGMTIKLLSTQLNGIKNELIKAVGMTEVGIKLSGYTGANTLIDDVVVSGSTIVNGITYTSSDYNNGRPLEINIAGVSNIVLKGSSYLEASVYNGQYLHTKGFQTNKYFKFVISSSKIDIYFYGTTSTKSNNPGSINKVGSANIIKLSQKLNQEDLSGRVFVELKQYNNENLLSTSTIQIGASGIDPLFLYMPKSATYETTYTKYVDVSIQSKSKVIPGVYDELVGIVNGKTDKSIDVTIPNTLTPEIQSVCPDLKTRLDILNPSIDYDTDIQTHTWDDATSSELPDEVDGTIDGTGSQTGTGEVDLGEVKDMPDHEDLELPAIITDKFPFSIPWDVKRAVECLVAAPEVPVFQIPFKIDSMNFEYVIEIDLSQFEAQAAVCRWFVTVIVCLGLIMATRKLIGQ